MVCPSHRQPTFSEGIIVTICVKNLDIKSNCIIPQQREGIAKTLLLFSALEAYSPLGCGAQFCLPCQEDEYNHNQMQSKNSGAVSS